MELHGSGSSLLGMGRCATRSANQSIEDDGVGRSPRDRNSGPASNRELVPYHAEPISLSGGLTRMPTRCASALLVALCACGGSLARSSAEIAAPAIPPATPVDAGLPLAD